MEALNNNLQGKLKVMGFMLSKTDSILKKETNHASNATSKYSSPLTDAEHY